MRVLLMTSMIALAASCLTPRPAVAIVCANCAQELTQILNHGELVVTAAKAYEQVEQAARHLQSLAMNFGPDVAQAMNTVSETLGTVQRVTYEVGQAEEAFLSRYQQVFNLAGVPQGMFGESAAQLYLDMRADMSAAMQESVRIRSIVAQAQKYQGMVEGVMGLASQASPGMLQAQQAGNALIQSTNARLSNLQSSMMSYQENQVRVQREGVLEGMVADLVHSRNMSCFGEGSSSVIVDPWGVSGSVNPGTIRWNTP